VSDPVKRRLGVAAGGVLGSATLVAVITLLARVTGFGRWFVYSGSVGSTCVGQAYLTSNQLPNVLFEVAAGGALASTVVPLVAGALARQGVEPTAAQGPPRDVDQITSALLTWAVVVLAPLSLLLAAVAVPVTAMLLRTEQCPGQADLAVAMLIVFAPQVLLYGIGAVLTGALQAHRRFLWPALAPLLSSLVVICCYVAFAVVADGTQDDAQALPTSAFWWLAGGTTAGVAVMTLPLFLPLRGTGVRLRPTMHFPPGVARRARALTAAGIAALVAQQVSVLVFLVLANGRGDKSTLTVFTYVQAVYLLPYAVLAVPLATTTFPRLAARSAADDSAGFAAAAARTTRAVLVVAALGAAVLAATAPAVEAFFAVINLGSVAGMALALTAIAPASLGYAMIAHVGRALYAVHAGRRAAVATSVGWAVVCLAAAVGAFTVPSPEDVVVVLAVGTTVGMTVAGIWLLTGLRAVAGSAALAGVLRTGTLACAAAGVGAVLGRVVSDAGLSMWGRGSVAAVGAGVLGAVAALAVLSAGTWLLDRDSVTNLRGGT
jgi:putative peptidoglycan lipid II flippase